MATSFAATQGDENKLSAAAEVGGESESAFHISRGGIGPRGRDHIRISQCRGAHNVYVGVTQS
jgi:hypothetical protein